MYRSRLLQSRPFIALCKNSSSKITSNCLISRYNQQCGEGVLTWIVDWHCILFCQHVSGVTMYSTIKRRNHEYEEERVKLGLMPRKCSSPLGYKRTGEDLSLTLGHLFQIWAPCVTCTIRDTNFGWIVSLVQLLIAQVDIALVLEVVVAAIVSWKCWVVEILKVSQSGTFVYRVCGWWWWDTIGWWWA